MFPSLKNIFNKKTETVLVEMDFQSIELKPFSEYLFLDRLHQTKPLFNRCLTPKTDEESDAELAEFVRQNRSKMPDSRDAGGKTWRDRESLL